MPKRSKKNNWLQLLSVIALLLIISPAISMAQTIDIKQDIALIDAKKCMVADHRHKRPYIFANQPKSFKTLNPVSLLYGGLLYTYQNTISQHFSADCLYHPSCSEFSKQSVSNFGLVKGGLLTIDRLNRCTRISSADIPPSAFDPKTHRTNDPVSKYK